MTDNTNISIDICKSCNIISHPQGLVLVSAEIVVFGCSLESRVILCTATGGCTQRLAGITSLPTMYAIDHRCSVS